MQKPPATTSALEDFKEDREAALADISNTACTKKVQLTPNKLIFKEELYTYYMFQLPGLYCVSFLLVKGVLKQFQCPHCEIAYSRNTRLNKHLEESHGITVQKLQKRYNCPYCDQDPFRTATDLVTHCETEHASQLCQ